MVINYDLAKRLLAKSDAPSIGALEFLLEADGFSEKINPLEVERANWYLQHIQINDKADQTNYLAPYSRGFIRRKNGGAIAAYGIRMPQQDSPYRTQYELPDHFFYITHLPQNAKPLDVLIDKSRNAPHHATKTLEKPRRPFLFMFGMTLLESIALNSIHLSITGTMPPENTFIQNLAMTSWLMAINYNIHVASEDVRIDKLSKTTHHSPAISLSTEYGIGGVRTYNFFSKREEAERKRKLLA